MNEKSYREMLSFSMSLGSRQDRQMLTRVVEGMCHLQVHMAWTRQELCEGHTRAISVAQWLGEQTLEPECLGSSRFPT